MMDNNSEKLNHLSHPALKTCGEEITPNGKITIDKKSLGHQRQISESVIFTYRLPNNALAVKFDL
jgi:hypothetical protein